MELTQEYVRSLFDYRDDGHLIWKTDRWPNKVKGKVAGTRREKREGQEYFSIGIDGKDHGAHRVIFLWHYGYLPKRPDEIDHRDGNSLNNRIGNLRHATRSQNAKNSKKYENNSSGYSGIYWNSAKSKWEAKIQKDRKTKYLGSFVSLDDAVLARKTAEQKYYGEFARGGA